MNTRYQIVCFLFSTLFFLPGSILAQNVGINNTNPEKDLDVIGNTRLQHQSTSSSNSNLEILQTGPASGYSRMKFSKVNESDFWLFSARPKSTGVSGWFNLFAPDLGNVFTISDAGLFGINTTPSSMLQVNSNPDTDPMRIQYNGSTKFRIFQNGSISMGTNNENISTNDVYIHNDLGIGVSVPTERLDVAGTIKSTGFQMTTGAGNGKVLVSNATGTGSWVTLSTGDNLGNHVANTILNMNNNRITNIGFPISNNDAATKSYVDALVGSGSGGSGIEDGDGDTGVATNTQDEIIFTANNSEVGVLGEGGFNLSFGNTQGIFIGENAGSSMNLSGTANLSIAIGKDALNTATSGYGNVAIGGGALSSSINTAGNTAIGTGALSDCTAGGNTAIGFTAVSNVTTGTNNTGIGNSAMAAGSTTMQSSVGVGYQSVYSGASFSVGVGAEALRNTNANNCVGIGYKAGYNHDGNDNVTIGSNAMSNSTGGGGFNVSIGSEAAFENDAGDSNVSIGYQALKDNTFGDDIVAIGYQALRDNNGGTGHTSVGYRAGLGITGGASNTSIGHLTNQSVAGGAQINNTAIGNSATNTGSNQIRLGNSPVTSIGGFANWSNVSDQRFKNNVTENVIGLDFIKELRPVTYNLDLHAIDDWYEDNLGIRDSTLPTIGYDKENVVYSGFLAQEVEATAQSLGYDFSGVDAPKNNTDFYGLRYAEFVVPLVKAVQELDTKAAILESENKNLKEIILNYEKRLQALEAKSN